MGMSERKNMVIQIMRGLAIIIVLIRHAIAQVNGDAVLDAAEEIIICFHMPVFFVIAGYLFQKKLDSYLQEGQAKFLADKVKHLLFPYIFWTVMLWTGVQAACMISPAVLAKMSDIGFAPMSVGNLLYGLLTYQVYYTEHLWFLYVLFVMFVINIFAADKGSSLSVLLVWGAVGMLTLFVTLPHIIERVMLWGIFFAFGRFCQANKKTEKMIGGGYRVCICLMFIICIVLRIIGLSSEMAGKPFAMLMLFNKYLIGFLGVMIIYYIADMLNKTRTNRLIRYIGDYSFDIYLMHNPYCVALSAIVLNKMMGISAYISVISATAIGIALPMAASKFIIRKIKPLAVVMIGKA